MLKQKRLMLVGALSITLLVSLSIVFNGRGQGQANQQGASMTNQLPFGQAAKDLDDSVRPIVDFENPTPGDTSQRNARRTKNARYDKYGSVKTQPHPGTGEVIWEPEWWVGLSDLPADKSDLVVEGIVADSKAFLSEDKTGVYSEFTVQVSRVFKVAPELSVNPGDLIVTERFGGKVRYASGQVVLYRAEGQGAPMSGKQYLFFLAKEEQGNYKLLTGYEIQGHKVLALDGSRINFRGKGDWKFDRHNGEDLDSFMGNLQKAINNSNPEGNRP
jgi:hypothetical protein